MPSPSTYPSIGFIEKKEENSTPTPTPTPVPTACVLHDERIRQLENGIISVHGEISMGAYRFEVMQNSIDDLAVTVKDSLGDIKSDVKSLSQKVDGLSTKVTTHNEQIKSIVERESKEDNRVDFLVKWAWRTIPLLLGMILAHGAGQGWLLKLLEKMVVG